MGIKKQAQDWPYLNKYRKENAAIEAPLTGENRIVFMGDSVTEFWSNIHPEFFQGKPYINRGISGQTSPQMLLRFRADVIALKPSAVVILCGGNDIAGNTGTATLEMIQNNIFSMVELAQTHHIKVILCSVLPANYFYWSPKEKPADTILALNKSIESYAGVNNIPYINYYSAMTDGQKGLPFSYSNDGVHPNKAGYQLMEPLVEKAISLILYLK
ncbi:SGNH/GDSL hydrolase family protein [Flavobacterium sp. ACAM 123]|jgi:lysophospholipase L1-like esterase|uniref:SGNH/GDSL hydrolase family protein n=1 Tax=Flavobacterium sp. ACAM 123 TaxID=1189620 RepID=UPI0002D901AD|nr:SGNH/GDSL hydrolase family protein [Flavobacterium sp. ACAM 123]